MILFLQIQPTFCISPWNLYEIPWHSHRFKIWFNMSHVKCKLLPYLHSEILSCYLSIFFKFKWKQAVFRMMLPKYMALTMCLNITPNDIFKRLSSWNKALAMVRLLLLDPQSKAEWQRFLTATFKTDAKYSQELYESSDPLTQ